jgi:hypothetical protein
LNVFGLHPIFYQQAKMIILLVCILVLKKISKCLERFLSTIALVMDKSWMDSHVFGAKDEPIEKLKTILSPSLHNQIQLFCGQ